jgi:hypothetical protein
MKAVINGYELFTIDEFDFFSLSLIRRMMDIENKRENARRAINARWERQKQLPAHTDVLPTYNERNTDELQGKESKVKESKVKESKENIYTSDSVPFVLAKRFFDYIKANNSSAKEPNIQSWAKDFDLMIRIDKRTQEQILQVMEFCQTDSFWMSNILSPGKLRKQFDQLWMKKDKPKQGKVPEQFTNFKQRKYDKDHFNKFYEEV